MNSKRNILLAPTLSALGTFAGPSFAAAATVEIAGVTNYSDLLTANALQFPATSLIHRMISGAAFPGEFM
jgi:hypothetical protein